MNQLMHKSKTLFILCFILSGMLWGCSDHKSVDSAKSQNFVLADFDTVKRAAEAGNANAQNTLGERYSIGFGVKQDDTEAMKWYQKAAEQGHANAQYHLGMKYAIEGNDTEAKKWFQKAADQGHQLAKATLEEMEKHE
jgi:TPR repeat protein